MDLNYDRKLVTKGKWLDYYVAEYTRKNGSQGRWEYVQRPYHSEEPGHADGVAPAHQVTIIPLLKKAGRTHLVLLAEFRKPVGKLTLALPGGTRC